MDVLADDRDHCRQAMAGLPKALSLVQTKTLAGKNQERKNCYKYYKENQTVCCVRFCHTISCSVSFLVCVSHWIRVIQLVCDTLILRTKSFAGLAERLGTESFCGRAARMNSINMVAFRVAHAMFVVTDGVIPSRAIAIAR